MKNARGRSTVNEVEDMMGRFEAWGAGSVLAAWMLVGAMAATAGEGGGDGTEDAPATTTVAATGGGAGTAAATTAVPVDRAPAVRRFEPIGLSIPSPYTPGKVPVVLVPGLWMGPQFWAPTIQTFESDAEVSSTHQFWTFGYATEDPITYSASRLRAALGEARLRLDPDRNDPALDRMVIIGHSMGGLVAKLAAVDSGDRFWRLASDQAPDRLAGDPVDVELARGTLIFQARPEVRKVVFLATPHHGGAADQRLLHDAARLLVRRPSPLLSAYDRLAAANPPDYFTPSFRAYLATSIDEMRWNSPLLAAVAAMRPPPTVTLHSIIAVMNGADGPGGGDDGVITFDSARLEGVDSETVVASGHFSCLNDPGALAEVRRILLDRTAP